MERLTCDTPGAARLLGLTVLAAASLTLFAPRPAGADTPYQIQPIVKLGDQVEDLKISGDFEIGGLNDNSQIAFVAENGTKGEILWQYADGKLTPIAGNDTKGPVRMNQLGNIVFAGHLTIAGKVTAGTLLWDYKAQQVTPVAVKGMPALNNRLFRQVSFGAGSTLNNRNEIALVAGMENNGDLPNRLGTFLVDPNGGLQPVAIPDQILPDGDQATSAFNTLINDEGVIGVTVHRQGDPGLQMSAYRWEQGTLSPLVMVGADAPGGGKFDSVGGVWVNNKNRNVLIGASIRDGSKTFSALYLLSEGKLTPVVLPGQEMPGGGTFKTLTTK